MKPLYDRYISNSSCSSVIRVNLRVHFFRVLILFTLGIGYSLCSPRIKLNYFPLCDALYKCSFIVKNVILIGSLAETKIYVIQMSLLWTLYFTLGHERIETKHAGNLTVFSQIFHRLLLLDGDSKNTCYHLWSIWTGVINVQEKALECGLIVLKLLLLGWRCTLKLMKWLWLSSFLGHLIVL